MVFKIGVLSLTYLMLILCLSIGEVPISFQSGSNEVPMETGGTQGGKSQDIHKLLALTRRLIIHTKADAAAKSHDNARYVL